LRASPPRARAARQPRQPRACSLPYRSVTQTWAVDRAGGGDTQRHHPEYLLVPGRAADMLTGSGTETPRRGLHAIFTRITPFGLHTNRSGGRYELPCGGISERTGGGGRPGRPAVPAQNRGTAWGGARQAQRRPDHAGRGHGPLLPSFDAWICSGHRDASERLFRSDTHEEQSALPAPGEVIFTLRGSSQRQRVRRTASRAPAASTN
jgi:hypothetical protein